MAAIIVPDGYQSVVLDRWDEVAVEIGRRAGDVLHWVNVKSHGQRLHLANTLASFDQAHVVAVVFSKWDTPNTSSSGTRQPDYLYNWLLRLMVERLSWFARDRGDTVKMTFAQVKGLDPSKLESYVERLRTCDTTIAWEALHLPVRIDTPANRRMLQVSDSVLRCRGRGIRVGRLREQRDSLLGGAASAALVQVARQAPQLRTEDLAVPSSAPCVGDGLLWERVEKQRPGTSTAFAVSLFPATDVTPEPSISIRTDV